MDAAETREIDLEGRRVAYALRRSGRARWLRAEVGLRTGLRVTLPAGLDESAVPPFLRSRRRWILRVLKRFERLASIVPDRKLRHGTTVPCLGRDLTLDLSVGEPRVGRRGETLVVRVPRRTRRAVADALGSWYREEAAREFGAWARELAGRHGLSYRKVVIGDPKSRWGSCFTDGTLSFNWRLMLGPEAVARYLAAHELAHRAVTDHSPRFWAKVGELCPSWREQESWLR
ncbi:MAG TPA: SprT family zinc-dependent metalloprotease, partial [Planctomycetota bacterium]|nr:SprT family zinc-dependent metalloprotease [Planctomycetota bacterium]